MSATDELRRLLDERGVEYRVSATGYSIDIGPSITAYANRTDTTLDVSLRGFTPEQAVEATLGSDLKAENEKLRELLDYITPIAWYAASENERDRMRELGVEE